MTRAVKETMILHGSMQQNGGRDVRNPLSVASYDNKSG
jgi:hypothetical protein